MDSFIMMKFHLEKSIDKRHGAHISIICIHFIDTVDFF